MSAVGLSATVREPADLQDYLGGAGTPSGLVTVAGGARPQIGMLLGLETAFVQQPAA